MTPSTNFTPSSDNISSDGKAKLLDMSYSRLRFGMMMTPIITFGLTWFYSLEKPPGILVFWNVMYICAGLAMPVLYRRCYLRDRESFSSERLIASWTPRLYALSLFHGLALALPVLLTAGTASFEFGIFLMLALSTGLTLNASYQSPVLGIFLCFFIGCWGLATISIYWFFPMHWQLMLPFAIAYGLTIYRHATKAHGFFINQILLEERAADSAAKFKAAKDDAEQALESKNLFLSTASHDLRQPVFAIGMLTEAIASQSNDVKIAPLLGSLRSSVQSLNLMFNSLLDLSRIEAGHRAKPPSAFNLQPLLSEVIAMFEPTAQAAGLQLRLRLPKSPVAVGADPDLLRQALVNLTHNAMRYTKRGGVLITVRKRGLQWQIEVWDTGMGVADSEHEKIYSPYYRSEHAWGADSTGHGLGLHVVARCAKLMGARYGLTSRLGRGSRFWLRLERADLATASAMVVQTTSELPTHHPLHGKCLVVEDDPQVVDAWAALLLAWQINARFATTAKEAFGIIRDDFEPQVIFCDLRLRSGESGFDILRDLLKAHPTARGAMVSGEYASPELVQAEEEGYLVIRKPLNIEQLYALLSRWLVK